MTHTHHEFNAEHIPLAYLITFRCYGTWLHGDPRGSVDRFNNRYGDPMIPANERWRKYNLASLKRPAVRLGKRRRRAIETAIKETVQGPQMVTLGVECQNQPHSHGGLCQLQA